MSIVKHEAVGYEGPAGAPVSVKVEDSPPHQRLVKVYLPSAAEKTAFVQEAASHGQDASQYARFVLQARQDPLMFLQLCRLRDPAFAQGLLGKPTEAGRVAELERDNLALAQEKADLERERHELAVKCEDLDKRLSEATQRQHALASQVVDLMRLQEANRERAGRGDVAFEAVPKPILAVIKALSVGGKPTRKELEGRLMEDGMTLQQASQAISLASRQDLIQLSAGARYVLVKPPEVDEE